MTPIRTFIQHKQVRRGITPATQAQYTRLLQRFHSWCRAEGVNPTSPTLEELKRYIEALNLRPASVHSHIVVLRSWGHWLVSAGHLEQNPAAELASIIVRHRLRPPVTESEVATLIGSIDAGTHHGARLLALVMLWYGCGLRLTESRGLDVRDIDLEARELRVLGKGDTWRQVIIPVGAVPVLRAWLDRIGTSRLVFPGAGKSGTIASSTAYCWLRDAVAAAGLRTERWHPHMLRHACAVHMLRGGANLRTIQRHLGHADIKMTERYLAIDTSDVRAAVDSAHPLG